MVDKAALKKAIPAGRALVLDTNVLIAYFEGGQEISGLATIVLDEYIQSGRNAAFIPMVAVTELLVVPVQQGADALQEASDFLQSFPNMQPVDLTFPIARRAAELHATHKFKTPDALVIATAMGIGQAILITNDRDWNRKLGNVPTAPTILTLKDYV